MSQTYFYINDSGGLSHHGILGMHWGVRRYQPYPKGKMVRDGKEIGKAAKRSERAERRMEKANKRIEKAEKKAAKAEVKARKAERYKRLNTRQTMNDSTFNVGSISRRDVRKVRKDEKNRKGTTGLKEQRKDVKAYSKKWKGDAEAIKSYVMKYGSYKDVKKAFKKGDFSQSQYNAAMNRLLSDIDARALNAAKVKAAQRRIEALFA